MKNQLLLIDTRPAWRLDRATREQGLQGIANARAVLRSVAPKPDPDDTPVPSIPPAETPQPVPEAA